MGRAGLRAALFAAALSPAAASPAAAAASWGSAASAPAEVEGQQECEHAAMRVEALQTGSALAGGAPSPAAEGASAEEQVGEEVEVEGNPYVLGPNLYLASIVDKENYRGYCLDIAGSPPHPYCGNLQGHSCKEEGEDTQFFYDVHTQQVRSLNFNSACNPLYDGERSDRTWSADTDNTEPACVTVKDGYVPGSTLGLSRCRGLSSQRIALTSSGQLQVGTEGSLCLVLGMNITDSYMDFMLRTAELQSCETWPAELSTWEALLADHTRLKLPRPSDSGEVSPRNAWPADSWKLA